MAPAFIFALLLLAVAFYDTVHLGVTGDAGIQSYRLPLIFLNISVRIHEQVEFTHSISSTSWSDYNHVAHDLRSDKAIISPSLNHHIDSRDFLKEVFTLLVVHFGQDHNHIGGAMNHGDGLLGSQYRIAHIVIGDLVTRRWCEAHDADTVSIDLLDEVRIYKGFPVPSQIGCQQWKLNPLFKFLEKSRIEEDLGRTDGHGVVSHHTHSVGDRLDTILILLYI